MILDDSKQQLNFLSEKLKNSFSIACFSNPLEALNHCDNVKVDAIIVDLHMPIINGIDFVKKVKIKNNEVNSIFILSADCSQQSKISALNLGISDYLFPDMPIEEMTLRINNCIKNSFNFLQYKNIKIDINNFIVYLDKEKLDITLIELKLLRFLIKHNNQIISRDDLKQYVWPDQVVLDKTLNTHLTNIRTKIIHTGIEIKSIKNEGIIIS